MRSRNIRDRALEACFFTLAVVATCPPASAQALTGWTDKQEIRRIAQFTGLTPEHFDTTSTIVDDDLEAVATIHTEEGFRFKGGFTDTVRANSFLRALVSKTSGAVIYQLYASVAYTGDWRFFDSATYATDEGPASTRLRVLKRDVDCTYGCVHTEAVAFDLPESFLRSLAQRAGERPVRPWRFRFKAKSGLDWTDDMAPAEAAGLLLAVDRYRKSHGFE